jgi:hypothetical protein
VRVRTSEGREGRFIVWGRKGKGEERDITAMKEKLNGNRTYCKTNKGLVYESVCGCTSPVPVGNDATARYGIRQGQKKELAKINYQKRKWI